MHYRVFSFFTAQSRKFMDKGCIKGKYDFLKGGFTGSDHQLNPYSALNVKQNAQMFTSVEGPRVQSLFTLLTTQQTLEEASERKRGR
jgi:hypothetical protein